MTLLEGFSLIEMTVSLLMAAILARRNSGSQADSCYENRG